MPCASLTGAVADGLPAHSPAFSPKIATFVVEKLPMNATFANDLFRQSIQDYHLTDDVDTPVQQSVFDE